MFSFIPREKFPELIDLVKNPRESRSLPNYVPDDKRAALHDEIDLFPRIKITHKLQIEDDTVEELTTDDFLTVMIIS
jgi:hypothetical protein